MISTRKKKTDTQEIEECLGGKRKLRRREENKGITRSKLSEFKKKRK